MNCTRFRRPSLGLATLAILLAGSHAASAALLSHFTFDADYSNAADANRDGTGAVGASIDNSVFKVGGGSVLFDGGTTPEYVMAGTNAVPGIQGAYHKATVALWFKAGAGLTVGSRVFMGQANGDPAQFGADNRMAFDLETDGNGKLRAFIRSADGTETNNRLRFSQNSSDPLEYLKWADGDWHHLAYCWEVDANGLVDRKMWLDGAPLSVVTQESTLELDPVKAPLTAWESPGMFIGANNQRSLQTGSPNPTAHVNGWIDDLRVYDECLSDAEIAALARVPEPSALLLAAAGVAGAFACGRRR